MGTSTINNRIGDNMFYVQIAKYSKPNHNPSSYIRTEYREFPTLDEARSYAIHLFDVGIWNRTTAYISQAFFPNKDVSAFIGKGVKGFCISKSKNGVVYGAVCPNKGKFYWVLNDKEHRKYLLNRDGMIQKEIILNKTKKKETHPFGL